MTRPTILDQDVVIVPMKADVGMLGAWYRYKNGHHWPDEDPPRDTSDVGAYAAMLAASPHADAWAEVRAYVCWLERGLDDEKAGHAESTRNNIRITGAKAAAEVRILELEEKLKEAERVLTGTRAIVSEAAMTGFNYADGDWPDKLFANQAAISSTMRNIRAFMEGSK